MKGFLPTVPNRPMTRLLMLGSALAWFAACGDEVNNVGSEDVLCVATTQPCASDSDCQGEGGAPEHTCNISHGVCVHCSEPDLPDPHPPDAGAPPPDDAGGDAQAACADPLPIPCANAQDCAVLPGTLCDPQTMLCKCPPAPTPTPTTCITPVDVNGDPPICFGSGSSSVGCEDYANSICDAQTFTCVCP